MTASTNFPPGSHIPANQIFFCGSVLPSPSQTYWLTIGAPWPGSASGSPGDLAVYRGDAPNTASPLYSHGPSASNSDGYFVMLNPAAKGTGNSLLFFGGNPGQGEYDYEWESTPVPVGSYWTLTDTGVVQICSASGQCDNALGITGDPVTGFQVTGINYNLGSATIQNVSLDTLFQETYANDTGTQQSNEIDNTWTFTRSFTFSGTLGFKFSVKVSGDVGLPLVANGKVEMSGETDVSFTVSETETYQEQWTLKQPVVVPPNTTVTATVTISTAQFTVPYTVTGNLVYQSGNTATISRAGTFTGVNGYDFQVTLRTGGPNGSVKVIHGPVNGTITKA